MNSYLTPHAKPKDMLRMYIYRTFLSNHTVPLTCVSRMTSTDPYIQDPITHVHSILSHSEKEKSGTTTSFVSGDSEGKSERVQFINTDDPFPESPDAPVEERQLTIRSVLVGCILGGIVAASNIYLGLKVRHYFK